MLTSQLVRVRRRGKRIEPTFLDTTSPKWLEVAGSFLGTCEAALEEGWTRGELQRAFEDQIGDDRAVKTLRGLIKLVFDRCTFEVRSPVPPIELRKLVFQRAVELGPLDIADGVLERPTASDVFASVAADLGIDKEAISESLYGDLKHAQVLTAARLPEGAEALLHRYNTALVQAVLFKAVDVRVRLLDPSTPRLRQLLRHAKFHQLMHETHREGDDIEIALDGPASVLQSSTRYGLALAKFFPAVLLQDGPWRLTARLRWGPSGREAELDIDHKVGLRTHIKDTGAYETREQAWFEERWAALGDVGWQLSKKTTPIELGGRGVILPDFEFSDGDRTASLEILGYWRRDYLERRLEGLQRFGPGNLVLAVSRKLAAASEALEGFEGAIVPFAKVVPTREVLAAIERVAR